MTSNCNCQNSKTPALSDCTHGESAFFLRKTHFSITRYKKKKKKEGERQDIMSGQNMQLLNTPEIYFAKLFVVLCCFLPLVKKKKTSFVSPGKPNQGQPIKGQPKQGQPFTTVPWFLLLDLKQAYRDCKCFEKGCKITHNFIHHQKIII